MVTKTISKRVGSTGSLTDTQRGMKEESRYREVTTCFYAFSDNSCWLRITKKWSGLLLTRLNGCASGDKANNSLIKSTEPPSWQVYTYIYILAKKPAFSRLNCSGAGATALRRHWLGDGDSWNALSISLFSPMANPVAKWWCSRQAMDHDSGPITAIPCQCSSG